MSDFTLVTNKKKKKWERTRGVSDFDEDSSEYFERLNNNVIKAVDTISSSELLAVVQSLVEESFRVLGISEINEIVCYGLGNISEDPNVRYQFGLLLELKNYLGANTYLYDPVFKKVEKEVMRSFGCNLIEINERGHRKATKPTLFFLPHCPHELLENLLKTNWGEDLCDCIIISNSILDSSDTVPEKLPFINKVRSFVIEHEIPVCFKPMKCFNDTSFHIFEKCKYIDLIEKPDPSAEVTDLLESCELK